MKQASLKIQLWFYTEKQNDVDEAKVDCGNDVQLTAVTNFTAKFSDKESVATGNQL